MSSKFIEGVEALYKLGDFSLLIEPGLSDLVLFFLELIIFSSMRFSSGLWRYSVLCTTSCGSLPYPNLCLLWRTFLFKLDLREFYTLTAF